MPVFLRILISLVTCIAIAMTISALESDAQAEQQDFVLQPGWNLINF